MGGAFRESDPIPGDTRLKVLVTGASGFVGRHLVPALLVSGARVTAVSRNIETARENHWFSQVTYVQADVHAPDVDIEALIGDQDYVVHLAWPGLPNYGELFHFERNLPADYAFLKRLVTMGVKRILVTGTCLEYGMQYGPLAENLSTHPTTPYGLAKDTLRRWLEQLREKQGFQLAWARLFYMYGPGQNPNSLLAQLERAIKYDATSFDMSGGEQLRDYLHVTEVAKQLSRLILADGCEGVFNCCSGQPISVRRLVEEYLLNHGHKIKLNFGVYPYPKYEPMAFWGDKYRLDTDIQ